MPRVDAPRVRLVAGVLGFAIIATLVGCNPAADDAAPSPVARASITLVVPRFNGGSLPTDATDDSFWLVRGYPAAQLRLGDTYDPVIGALQRRTPSPAHVLPAPYDWRMPGAPVQGPDDGRVEGLLAHWNDPDAAATFTYAVDYLRHWLIEAARADPGASAVNVVAHSTGVSIVRAYLQSDAYGASVLDASGQRVTLPRIDRLVMAAPPQLGAPFVWNLWNGNFLSFLNAPRGADIFRGYDQAYRFVLDGGVIEGPAGDISRDDLVGVGLERQVSFLRAYNPLFRLVLPTSSFLVPMDSPGQNPVSINATENRNDLLLDLNAGSVPGHNPWAGLAARTIATYPVRVLTEAGQGAQTVQTAVRDRTRLGAGGKILPFTEFSNEPRSTVPTVEGQTWFEEIVAADAGDGAFPLESMQSMFFDGNGEPDPGVMLQQWGNGRSEHSSGVGAWTSVDGDLSHNLFIENDAIADWIAAAVYS